MIRLPGITNIGLHDVVNLRESLAGVVGDQVVAARVDLY